MNYLLKKNVNLLRSNNLSKFLPLSIRTFITNNSSISHKSKNLINYTYNSHNFSTKKVTFKNITIENVKKTSIKDEKVTTEKRGLNPRESNRARENKAPKTRLTRLYEFFVDDSLTAKKYNNYDYTYLLPKVNPPISASNLTLFICTPFMLSTAYIAVKYSYLYFSNLAIPINSVFFALRAFNISQAINGGILFGFNAVKLDEKLNKDEDHKTFDYAFPRTILPGLSSMAITQYVLLFPTNIYSISFCFLGYYLILRVLNNMNTNITLEGTGPVWWMKCKKRIVNFELFFLFVLYLILVLNMDAFNERKKQLAGFEKLKNIFELEDKAYKVKIVKHKHLINAAEMNLGWNAYHISREVPEEENVKEKEVLNETKQIDSSVAVVETNKSE